ncbi:FH2 domain-containing protein 1 [Syngnathoides biaculeatus]|uniref:FH2 domain-containing protein 1 n=1 Tax=Syngnathoides biaculeatus TaxID=300417 RepID=UPI002ADE769C|nr:FH2 domain-containing protein 1 [Syngnathoides biaculeatus]
MLASEPQSCRPATSEPPSLDDVPAPPPLPPPPPPPPPPMLPQPSRKKHRVRSFFWKPIPEEKVRERPNIWTLVGRQQQYQIDVRSVEELFGQQEATSTGGLGSATAPGTGARVSRSRSFKDNSKKEISILDSKRAMNVGIFLKQFKKSNRCIVEDIRRGHGGTYGAQPLKDLLKLLPDTDETKKLQAFRGDPDKLTLVDSFMFLLIQVPLLEVRIEAMVLSEEFLPSCALMSHDIDVVRVATRELMSCEELHAILHLVLQAGNIMNAGGYAGNAVGFKLSSLLSLADTKANKPGMNLLHFVAMEAKKKDGALLRFPEKLVHIHSAARISVENMELEFSSLYIRIRTLEEKVQRDPGLLQQLQSFLQSSVQTLADLEHRCLELRKEGNALVDFFCEDKDAFKLDEGFRIFHDFCVKFKKAIKDNADRELKEAARQHRLRDLEEKRLAWSIEDCGSGGAFARSSSENDVETLTKEGLLDFFQGRSKSPHSPPGRSSSARRHRHTMTSIADRELQSYLELFGDKFNSLPRSGRAHQRKTTPWIDNRELTSPRAESEPISPLARFSSAGLKADEDQYNNNNSGNQWSPRFIDGHMNVNVEKHTLVPGPQAFHLQSPNCVNQDDIQWIDPEQKKQPPSRTLDVVPGAAIDLTQEDKTNSVSSTTCDTPLPSDTPLSNRKPAFNMPDSTEADCSVTLDVSEVESSSLSKDGLHTGTSDKERETPGELSSPSAVLDSVPPRDSSVPRTADAASATPTEWETESCDITVVKEALRSNGKPVCTKSKTGGEGGGMGGESCFRTGSGANGGASGSGGKGGSNGYTPGGSNSGVRTLTSSESQSIRKVVPISRLTRAGSKKKPETALDRPLRDQSTPPRGHHEKTPRPQRHSSLPPDDSKAKRGSHPTSASKCTCDSTNLRKTSSINKPSAKPLRHVPKPAPEEKMCRSTMRALAQAEVLGGTSSENGSLQAPSSKSAVDVPSFARNTVASSSRTKKEPVALSTPSHVTTVLSRHPSIKQTKLASTVSAGEERTTLRRVHSVKTTSRSAYRSQTPPAQSREAGMAYRSAKPSWK